MATLTKRITDSGLNGLFRISILVVFLVQLPLWASFFGVMLGRHPLSDFIAIDAQAAGAILLCTVVLAAKLWQGGVQTIPALGRLTLIAMSTALAEFLVVHSGKGLVVAAPALAVAWVAKKCVVPQRVTTGGYAAEAPAPQQWFAANRQRTDFSQITGMGPVKARLLDAAHEVLQAHKTAAADTRNGILLFGEPGNGKTMFAEALAGELNLRFINVSFGDVVSKWVGETTENVVRVFECAREQAPCVLFIDEIDSLIRDRSASTSGGHAEEAKTTNALLTELVKLRGDKVVLVAATNFLDKLDPAAIREGRFDYKIEITPPDQEARAGLLEAASRTRKPGIDPAAIERAAQRWEGFSVSRIRAVAKEAQILARKRGEPVARYADLQSALRTTQGRAGRIPEGTPQLAELTFPQQQRDALAKLAARLTRAEEIEAAGGSVPKGILFYGPPGTGKTLTARALAKTVGWAFLSVSGNTLLSDPDKVDAIAKEARDIRPCIIFIDEADDLLADRQFSRHTAPITNRLLTVMDGAEGRTPDLLWIAATNHPDTMDPAALRGGRLTEKIGFSVPDEDALAALIERFMASSPAQWLVSVADIAAALHGLAPADVSAVLQEAVNAAVTRGVIDDEDSSVENRDIDAALCTVAGG